VLIKKNSLPKALWWDTGDFEVDDKIPPYHFIRTEIYDDDSDLLLIGGEDHATGLADAQDVPEENRYDKLETWARKHFDFQKVVYKWSGQVLEPVDCLGFIGHNPLDKKNVYIVTGDSGNGLTHASIAGMLIPDLINERENKWEKIYSPSRFKIKSISTWIKEFGGGLVDYIKNNPHDTDKVQLSSIEPGEGKIIQLDKEKYGAFRDQENNLHFVSAECTHLQCTVKWNGDEKSWDCPCHGSRFTTDGKVINGPANKPLFYWTEEHTVLSEELNRK
jgi:nitrite reductase/ring-hydroxylating ferredoxin subunit